MMKRRIAVAMLSSIFALCLAGCGSSDRSASSSSQVSSQMSQASSESSTDMSSEEASDLSESISEASESAEDELPTTVFGKPRVVNLISGSGNNIVGTSANFYATEADCTESNLATWYDEYVRESSDNFCIIVYTDKPGYGVSANAGSIEVNVMLEEDENDASYSTKLTDETVFYSPSSSGDKLIKLEDLEDK